MSESDMPLVQKDIIDLITKYPELRFFVMYQNDAKEEVAFGGNSCPRCALNLMIHWLIENGIQHDSHGEETIPDSLSKMVN